MLKTTFLESAFYASHHLSLRIELNIINDQSLLTCLTKASAEKIQERKRVMIMKKKEQNLDRFQFSTSCRNAIIQHEKHYTITPAKDWNEAKNVFNFGKKIVDFALQLFASIEDQTKSIEVSQILSKMYKHLAPFQKEKIASNDALARLCKIQWRRVQCLEPFLKVLTPEEDTVKVQELTFEFSEVYMELLELKQKKFERTAGNLEPKLLQKMVCTFKVYYTIIGCLSRLTIVFLEYDSVKSSWTL